MKRRNHSIKRLAGLTILLLAVVPGPAQGPMPGQPPGLTAAMTRLFGDVKAFSSTARVRVLNQAQKETMTMTMTLAYLEGRMRAEVNMASIQGAMMPPGAAENFKQMGMDRMVSVTRQDKNQMYIIYPALQAYADMSLPKEETAAGDKDMKIEKLPQGKETVDGHACTKNKVIITDGKGQKMEMLVWNASDLKDFPVQMQMTEKGDTVVVLYQQVQFAKPEASQFEPPAGYTKHDSIEALMLAGMKKASGTPGQK